MKILIITFDPPRNVGGIEGRANNYSKHLVGRGHSVEVFSFSPHGDFSKETLHNATVTNFPSSSGHVLQSFRRSIKEISKNSIDSIFLLSGALTIYGLMMLFYARWKGVKTTVLYYGKDILSAKNDIQGSIALWISPILAKKIAVNSLYTATLLPKFHSKKINILYPSVDPEIVKEVTIAEDDSTIERIVTSSMEKSDLANEVDSSKLREKRILFVGRLVKRKGVDDLMNAFRNVCLEFPEARLEIVGDGPEYSSLQKLAKELGVSQNIKFFGKLSGPSLYERYRLCDVFVMPSKTTDVDVEGFGTVFLEAGIFAKASIGTKSGGIPEAIKDGITGILVPESNVPILTEALKRILSNRDLAERLGRNARAMILDNFTWDKSTRYLISILEPGM